VGFSVRWGVVLAVLLLVSCNISPVTQIHVLITGNTTITVTGDVTKSGTSVVDSPATFTVYNQWFLGITSNKTFTNITHDIWIVCDSSGGINTQ
jgi:hypothetical protein